MRWREDAAALAFATPLLVIFGLFSWGPMLSGAVMSLQEAQIGVPARSVGLDNFRYVLGDPLLADAAMNTLWFTVLALIFGMPLPLLTAVLISESGRWRAVLLVLAYIPVILPSVVAILLWRFMFDPSASGILNRLIGLAGIPPQPWLDSPASAMPSIVLEATWASFGTATVIYVAALASVPRDLYEVAELDGAGILSRVWHVTLPHLRGVVLMMILLQIIGTMQVFAEPFLMTGGGPENSTLTVLMLIYQYAFVRGDLGAATALSLMLAGVLAVVSAAFTLQTRGWSEA
jgi:multiple sugar transport system permease protein